MSRRRASCKDCLLYLGGIVIEIGAVNNAEFNSRFNDGGIVILSLKFLSERSDFLLLIVLYIYVN